MSIPEDILPDIVQLFQLSKAPNKQFWDFDDLFFQRFSTSQKDETKRISRFKIVLRYLRTIGAITYKDDFSDIRLNSIKLCILTTNPSMPVDELIRRSQDPGEDCNRRNYDSLSY